MKAQPVDRKSGPRIVSRTVTGPGGHEIRVQVHATGHVRWNCPQLGAAFTGRIVNDRFKPYSAMDENYIACNYVRKRATTCKNGTYWPWKK